MKYEKIKKGVFLERPNRFIAMVNIDGQVVKVHVKNTGRCKELLTEGATVYLEDFDGRIGSRKMRYSLIGVEKKGLLINMDSQAPNKVVMESLKSGQITVDGMGKLTEIKGEKTFGQSRFDFYLKDEDGREAFIEVKGVTLEEDGVAKFPDAPTERGTKHIQHLIMAKEEGYMAMILFVVQMEGMKSMLPNWNTDERFAKVLCQAEKAGVLVKAIGCNVGVDTLKLDKYIPVYLSKEWYR